MRIVGLVIVPEVDGFVREVVTFPLKWFWVANTVPNPNAVLKTRE